MAKQVLQTLSILIQNIRSTTAIFYLFSNNVVNEIVAMRFDFEDDEVLGYFINLLKTISLKFNASTVQFFFQDDGERSSFPLYTEAVKFINHRCTSYYACFPLVNSYVANSPLTAHVWKDRNAFHTGCVNASQGLPAMHEGFKPWF